MKLYILVQYQELYVFINVFYIKKISKIPSNFCIIYIIIFNYPLKINKTIHDALY